MRRLGVPIGLTQSLAPEDHGAAANLDVEGAEARRERLHQSTERILGIREDALAVVERHRHAREKRALDVETEQGRAEDHAIILQVRGEMVEHRSRLLVESAGQAVEDIVHRDRIKALPADDPKQRRPDITLAKKYLKWEPKVPLAQGLKLTIDYFKTKL